MLNKTGFVLIPSKQIIDESLALSKAIPQNELALDADFIVPHVTVLQTHFTPNFKPQATLQTFADYSGFKHGPSTTLGAVELHHTYGLKGLVWWNVANAHWLKTFNRELITSLEREIAKPTFDPALKFSSPEAEESFYATGYERNLAAYEPHITLGIVSDSVELPQARSIGATLRFFELAYVEHGKRGEILKVIDSIPLKQPW